LKILDELGIQLRFTKAVTAIGTFCTLSP
jgi:hypothetical protein